MVETDVLSLPIEVLHNIYFHAENPHLSHVCRTFRNVFPSFTTYTSTTAENVFGLDPFLREKAFSNFVKTYDQWQHLEIPPEDDRRRMLEDLATDEQILAQGLLCERWMTVGMLRKVRQRLVFRMVQDVYHLVGAPFVSTCQERLNWFLESTRREPFLPIMAECPFLSLPSSGRMRSDVVMTDKYEIRVVVTKHMILVYLESTDCLALVLQPFMLSRKLYSWILPQLARLDERSRMLAHELLSIHVKTNLDHYSGAMTSLTQMQPNLPINITDDAGSRKTVIQATRDLLDSAQRGMADSQMDLAKECLHLLLLYDAPLQRHRINPTVQTLPRLQRDRTHPKNRPVYIDLGHYNYCIVQRNVPGFSLLLAHNPALHNPSLHEIKRMVVRALIGHNVGPDDYVMLAPRELDTQLVTLLEHDRALGRSEYIEMMTVVFVKAKELGYQLDHPFHSILNRSFESLEQDDQPNSTETSNQPPSHGAVIDESSCKRVKYLSD